MTWNFEKFIVTPAGQVSRFRLTVQPDAPEILDLIERSLPTEIENYADAWSLFDTPDLRTGWTFEGCPTTFRVAR